jgi:nucleoid-associated protein YgaU
MTTENTRKYGGIAALGLLALCAIAGLLYLSSKPELKPTPAAPPAPSAATVVPPAFDVVRVDAQGNTVLAGRGVPGATITIKSGSAVIGTTTADAQGAFVLVPANPLPPGAQEITLSETLPDGTVIAGAATASVNVPAGAGQALAVVSGPNGSSVLSGQGPQPGTLGMGTVDYDANGHAIFSGTAPAEAQVSVNLNGKLIGRAMADKQGRWKFSGTVPKESGTITLSGTDANGAVLPAVNAPFALETLPNALAAGHVVISSGDNLWLIARHVYGAGNMYTLIYTANASQIHNPNLIFPGQAFALPNSKKAE